MRFEQCQDPFIIDTRVEARNLLRRQGQREWDECEDCVYVGFGQPTSHHRMDYPEHQVVHVMDIPKRHAPPTAGRPHLLRFNSRLMGMFPTLTDAVVEAQMLMHHKGGEWRKFNTGMWRQGECLVTVFPE